MNTFTKFSAQLLALTFAAAIFLAGCSNPASNDDDDHDDHSELYGIEFIMDGETIVTYLDGDTEGHFEISEGQESSPVTATFLDEDGHEIHAEDLDDEYYLDWNIGNTEIADVEKDDNSGRWSFHITGKSTGETTIQFLLMHEGDHDAFRTPPVDGSNAISIHVQNPTQ